MKYFGLNTILFQKYFKYTCIIDIQQIDQDLIVSSWLIYIISWFVFFFWFKCILQFMNHEIFSVDIFPPSTDPLIQEGQLSVTGKSMGT